MSTELVNLLMQYEKELAKLYATFATTFPEHSSFWKKLSNEELMHAALVKEILQKVDNKTVFIDSSRFKIRPLEISIEYAQEVSEKAEKGELNMLGALSIANTIENSIIEANYYEVFAGDSAGLNQALKKLQEASALHRQQIRALLEKLRP